MSGHDDESVPPGWYPKAERVEGYWDGSTWTGETRRRKRKKNMHRDRSVVEQQQLTPPTTPRTLVRKKIADGLIAATTTMRIYDDGTFTTGGGFGGGHVTYDDLLGFEHDADSMRRKSTTGRGAAALLTGGASLLASNNRGVIYVTVTGANAGPKTYTTRNPSGTQLTGIRTLHAAAQRVLAGRSALSATDAPRQSVTDELVRLLALRDAGHLTADEYAAAKARVLGI